MSWLIWFECFTIDSSIGTLDYNESYEKVVCWGVNMRGYANILICHSDGSGRQPIVTSVLMTLKLVWSCAILSWTHPLLVFSFSLILQMYFSLSSSHPLWCKQSPTSSFPPFIPAATHTHTRTHPHTHAHTLTRGPATVTSHTCSKPLCSPLHFASLHFTPKACTSTKGDGGGGGTAPK